MNWKALKILLLFVQPSCLAVIDICELKGKDLVIHRNYKTGETACCLSVRCLPGQEAVICDRDDPWSTDCRSCPDGTYQSKATDSVDMLHCSAKTQCYGNLSARNEKSKTGDTRCICDPKIGFCNPNGVTKNPRFCVKKTCPQGFALTSKCTCEVCIKPANKSRTEQKPCDKRNHLCKSKRGTSDSEQDSGILCPEDSSETSTEAAVVPENSSNNGNSWLTSPSSGVPYFASLISSLSSVGMHHLQDHLNKKMPLEPGNTSVSWFSVFIPLILTVVGLFVIILIVLVRNGFCRAESTSPGNITKSASAVSSSTADTELDGIEIEACKEESSSLMADAVKDNDAMKPSDKEKLTAQRPNLVKNLVFDECLWAILLSNGTVTLEMKTIIESSSTSDSEKAGTLITYLLKRNSRAFVTFLAALIFTKQEHLAKALDPALTTEINQTCQEDHLLTNYLQNLV